MTSHKKRYAVLTGDVVNSSKLTPKELKQAMDQLRKGAERFEEKYPESILGSLDVYSGDSWQMLMPDWNRSIRAALYLRAIVKSIEKLKIDTRIALAWGDIDENTLNPERISETTGAAFKASGHALAEMPKGSRMAFVTDQKQIGDANQLLSLIMILVDEIASKWKRSQARAMYLSLLEMNQMEIAEELQVKQPTVHEAIQSGGWQSLRQLIETLENREIKL